MGLHSQARRTLTEKDWASCGACVTSWVSCQQGSLLLSPQSTVLGSLGELFLALETGKLKGIPSNFAVSRESPTPWAPKSHFSLSAQPPRLTETHQEGWSLLTAVRVHFFVFIKRQFAWKRLPGAVINDRLELLALEEKPHALSPAGH